MSFNYSNIRQINDLIQITHLILPLLFFTRPFTKEMACAIYQPNSVETMHKKLFSFLATRGVLYSFSHDFNQEGGFQAYWIQLYAMAQSFRDDLGNKPHQAAVDFNSEKKIRECGRYDPFQNYNDMLKLLVRNVIKYFALRGSLEVSYIFLSIQLIFILTHLLSQFFSIFSAA